MYTSKSKRTLNPIIVWGTLAVLSCSTTRFWAGEFIVSTAADSGEGSLRWAIEQANATVGSDVITFAIPGAGPHTIRPTTPLPIITDPVTIDGYTQLGSSMNNQAGWLGINTVLKVVIDGISAGEYEEGAPFPVGVGLAVSCGQSTIRGLAVANFACHGIALIQGGHNIIEGCFLGTDATGTIRQGNGLRMPWPGAGVVISGSATNVIGGIRPEARNLISGNRYGIQIEPGDHNVIQGNFVGTDARGTAAIPNELNGIRVFGPWEGYSAIGNQIGGREPGTGNLISGNHNPASDTDAWASARGVQTETGPWAIVIQGNRIGTDVTGRISLGNDWGIQIGSGTGCLVGGTTPDAGNLVSGNNFLGMFIQGVSNVIQGNLIGTDVVGTAPLGNGYNARSWGPIGGVVLAWSSECTVGGLTPEARNVISDNQSYGGLQIGGDGGSHWVAGNYFGTDKTGTQLVGKQNCGVFISETSENRIGGAEVGAGNVIAGCGIDLRSPNNTIQGNFVGVDSTGQHVLGVGDYTGAGVYTADNGHDNQIGGTALGAGNIIAVTPGIRTVQINGQHRTRIQGNQISGGGVLLSAGASDTLIGGIEPGAGNVIVGSHGMWETVGISLYSTARTRIEGNYIGTDRLDSRALGCDYGVWVGVGATDTKIGGVEPNAANLIAYNLRDGVVVSDSVQPPFALRNTIVGNSIHDNEGLGINLMPWGPENPWGPSQVTANDVLDEDLGPNGLQNFPVIVGASALIGKTRIEGWLDSTPNTPFRLDFYGNREADPSRCSEGETHLGTATVDTDLAGHAQFTVVVDQAVIPGQNITSTATDPTGNTSEFSIQSPPVVRGIIEVAIDIKPGSFPNSINLGSHGTVPVAILGSTTFDVRDVDPTTITLSEASLKLTGKGTPMAALEDVNGDGQQDLVVHVLTAALQLSASDTQAVLQGRTTDGMPILGRDSVRIVP